ncbi:MAG: Zinc ribbon protein [Ignavibacteria bacterium]|nr:Zinc ribbon protein [Ignavibacteria bacterium]
MPTFNYRCNNCNSKFQVFHKVREIIEDIICPDCLANSAQKLVSSPNIGSVTKSYEAAPMCGSGECQSGVCQYN